MKRYLRHCCGKVFRAPKVYMVHRRWYCTRRGWSPQKQERLVDQVLR